MHTTPFFPHAKRSAQLLILLLALWLLVACAVPIPDAIAPAEPTPLTHSDVSAAPAPPETASVEPASAEAAASDVLFTRHREGGIAGFCDDITVYSDGLYEVESCRSNADDAARSAQLTDAQIATIAEWASTFESFAYNSKDPATADAMTVSLEFYGMGDEVASDEQQQEMVTLANNLFMQVGS